MELQKIPEEKLFEDLLLLRLSGLDLEHPKTDKCPSCSDTTGKYIIDKLHRIGYCTSCRTFEQFPVPAPNKHTRGNVEWDIRAVGSIMEESHKHLDDKFLQMELEAFGLTRDLIEEYKIGFYPYTYWIERDTDWKFGKLLFPMESFDGEPINVVGKSVGKKEKVLKNDTQVLYPRNSSVFNRLWWFNPVVNVFTDPVDVLIALQEGHKNSVLLSSRADLPTEQIVQTKINVVLNGGVQNFPLVNLFYYAKKYEVELNVFDVIDQKENVSSEILERL